MKIEIITPDADPERGGSPTRVHSLVRIFSQFAEVTVVRTDWFGGPEVPGVRYENEPVKDNLRSKIRRLRTYYKTDFPRRRRTESPDFAIIESLDLVGLHQDADSVPWVLDEHDVHWDQLRYEMVNSPFFKTWLGRRGPVRRWLVPRLQRRAREFEVDALRRAAKTLVTSPADRCLILEELPDLADRVHVLPNCIDPTSIRLSEEPIETNRVLFVGNYNYVPNREAATYISRTLAPALPEAEFLLVGSHPPSDVSGRNVVAPGYVEDLQPILAKATVCIAPLTHGSGTRLKVLTYLAAGKAVVATTKACEGLEVENEIHLLIRDEAKGFTAAIRKVLTEPNLRKQLGTTGRRLVETRYDWRVYVEWAKDFARAVQDPPRTHGAAS